MKLQDDDFTLLTQITKLRSLKNDNLKRNNKKIYIICEPKTNILSYYIITDVDTIL